MNCLFLVEFSSGGCMGIVKHAKWRGLDVAVKHLQLESGGPISIRNFCEEIAVMYKLKHPYICQFFV